jgi:hypothetical protein
MDSLGKKSHKWKKSWKGEQRHEEVEQTGVHSKEDVPIVIGVADLAIHQR